MVVVGAVVVRHADANQSGSFPPGGTISARIETVLEKRFGKGKYIGSMSILQRHFYDPEVNGRFGWWILLPLQYSALGAFSRIIQKRVLYSDG